MNTIKGKEIGYVWFLKQSKLNNLSLLHLFIFSESTLHFHFSWNVFHVDWILHNCYNDYRTRRDLNSLIDNVTGKMMVPPSGTSSTTAMWRNVKWRRRKRWSPNASVAITWERYSIICSSGWAIVSRSDGGMHTCYFIQD